MMMYAILKVLKEFVSLREIMKSSLFNLPLYVRLVRLKRIAV